MTTLQTQRFILESDFADELSAFAKVHQYDHRKDFKEAWTSWINQENIKPLLESETSRLLADGYKGDVLIKLFKSARYYYRKRTSLPHSKEQGPRKKYEMLPADVLKEIDEHIYQQIENHVDKDSNKSNVSPAKSFTDYLENHATNHDIEKMKKTYKNRFYKIRLALEQN